MSELLTTLTVESLHFFGCNGFYALENLIQEEGIELDCPRPISKEILETFLGENGVMNLIEGGRVKIASSSMDFSFHFGDTKIDTKSLRAQL